jgi:hypothetical protein
MEGGLILIFLKDMSINDLYTLNREAIEKLAANHGEFVNTKKDNEKGTYLTNNFKILFDEDTHFLQDDEYKTLKERSDKDIDFILKKLNKKYAKNFFIRNILCNIKGLNYFISNNKKEIIFFFKDKQKELIIEILNHKTALQSVLHIISIDEIIHLDNNFASATLVFPIVEQRYQVKHYQLLKKIGTQLFILRQDIPQAKKKLEELYGKNEVIIQEDEKLCERI